MDVANKKIAIVYDWLDKWGGVERVLLTLHDLLPEAIFYTSYFDKDKASWAKDLTVQTSFIHYLPEFIRSSRMLSLPFYPYAFESFGLDTYDLVISVTSSFAKGIITRPETKHLCYLLTPTRYVWGQTEEYLNSNWKRALFSGKLAELRKWDYLAAQRPDKFISISQAVAERCEKYYHQPSEVIYPPFDTDYWSKIKQEITVPAGKKFFLVVSRLEPYKRVDLAIKAFREIPDKELIIVGKGSEKQKLVNKAPANVIFVEDITDKELASYYAGAEALIMPQEEEFGYVAVEAQFFGCPVIAYSKGGASETVLAEKTGVFFHEQTADSLKNAVARFHTISYNLKVNLEQQGLNFLEKFSKKNFQKQFINSISKL